MNGVDFSQVIGGEPAFLSMMLVKLETFAFTEKHITANVKSPIL